MRIEFRRCGRGDNPENAAAGHSVKDPREILKFLGDKNVWGVDWSYDGCDQVQIDFQDASSLWIIARGGRVRVVLQDRSS
jgi:hypothetical protein